MLSIEMGKSRTIAYGGDTWVWARSSEEGRLAHRKLWRQIIFWLSHKENDSENQVKLTLDRRRVAVGEKVEVTATARDCQGSRHPQRPLRNEGRARRTRSQPRAGRALRSGRGSARLDLRHRKGRPAR